MPVPKIQPPSVLLREWLHHPHAPTIALFAGAALGLGIAGWLVLRNVRRNEPGLKAPAAFVLALAIAAGGILGAHRLPERWFLPVGGAIRPRSRR